MAFNRITQFVDSLQRYPVIVYEDDSAQERPQSQTVVLLDSSGLPVNFSSLGGIVTANQGGTWNLNNITGTISLPTGAATAALQTTIIGHIDGIEALITSLNSKVTVVNTGAVVLSATNFTDTFSNSGPGDGVQLGFQDQQLGDYQRQHGSSNAAWVNLRDRNGNEVVPMVAGDAVVVASSVQPAGFTTIGVGNRNVTTAGTRVTLASSTACKKVVITAKSTNTGIIWVGGNTVAAGSGIPLVAYQQFEIDIANLVTVNIDSTVNGEGVTYAYYN